MSLYATCPCGIPEGSEAEHLRTDCPHYGTPAMTNQTTDEAAVEQLFAEATPTPWEVDSEKDTDGPDRHTYYKMFGPDGKVLFDSLNTDVAYLHEEYDVDETGSWSNVWDEQSRANFALIAYAVNNFRAERLRAEQAEQNLAEADKAIRAVFEDEDFGIIGSNARNAVRRYLATIRSAASGEVGE